MKAARIPSNKEAIQKLYSITQKERNMEVKNMCKMAGWFWKDVKGIDGQIYTSFSPEKIILS
jgi:hypothetical protein